MLLVHQAGSVKVGEVVRYTLTYTPSHDRVLPTPTHLHLKVKNTAAIPLRAAWVHGPYALHIGAYPATFNPHQKIEHPERDGAPEYEPMVKAGGSWTTKLLVPEAIRETGADLGRKRPHSAQSAVVEAEDKEAGSITWIVEIASQILFSSSASVGYELLVGRDERGLDLGFAAVAGRGHGGPAQLKEHTSEQERAKARRKGNQTTDGVYSKAVRLVVEDTETLWDKPALPTWEGCEDGDESDQSKGAGQAAPESDAKNREESNKSHRKRRNVHLVIVTHGLHSNIGADMLFLKESIDATVRQARVDARKRKQKYHNTGESEDKEAPANGDSSAPHENPKKPGNKDTSTAPLSGGQEDLNNETCASDDEEETIVRGFTGNAIRTENGIQYLGKRLAKYILRFTYPDQPFLPIKKTFSQKFSGAFASDAEKTRRDGKASHSHSSIHHPLHGKKPEDLPYKFTSISFIGHSLGGLIQTYAIAYIHKHSPTFFTQIQPINFVCMASPMLGLSNENPMYVKFALDFGLVGRSGQDLGLTWRPPTMARSGWNAVIGGLSGVGQKDKDAEDVKKKDAAAKPLLRVLPTGPAHHVLRLFRNRTLYSNVVNDGIVPLRTSCLLFLDWRGLGKVEKARRENGFVGTMAEWGWAELTGANSSTIQPNVIAEQYGDDDEDDAEDVHVRAGEGETVPQPAEDETTQDNKRDPNRISYEDEQPASQKTSTPQPKKSGDAADHEKGMLDTFLHWLRPSDNEGTKTNGNNNQKTGHQISKKTSKAIRRAQTIQMSNGEDADESDADTQDTTTNPNIQPGLSRKHTGQVAHKRPKASRGDSLTGSDNGEVRAPPVTSIFESAGDLLHPPLPSKQWLADPSTRTRTIFHDRVYHPEDIPPPPLKRTGSRNLLRTFSNDSSNFPSGVDSPTASRKPSSGATTPDKGAKIDTGGMKVEEKIARAYHKDLSWRKVLVRLEPDAHNNMIVRRMFANAYGWPVIKHLCDTHFADTYSARTRDEQEPAQERALPLNTPIDPDKGEQVREQTAPKPPVRSPSEMREARDELADLNVTQAGVLGSSSRNGSVRGGLEREGSGVWDDAFFEGSDGEDSDAVDERNVVAKFLNPNVHTKKPDPGQPFPKSPSRPTSGSSSNSAAFVDGHRGLSPTTSRDGEMPASPTRRRSTAASVKAARANFIKPTFDSGDVEGLLAADKLVEEPEEMRSPPLAPRSPLEVGLSRSLGESVAPSSPAAVLSGLVRDGGSAPAEDAQSRSK